MYRGNKLGERRCLREQVNITGHYYICEWYFKNKKEAEYSHQIVVIYRIVHKIYTYTYKLYAYYTDYLDFLGFFFNTNKLGEQHTTPGSNQFGRLSVRLVFMSAAPSSYYILASNIAWRTLDTLSDQYCQLLHKGMSAYSMEG